MPDPAPLYAIDRASGERIQVLVEEADQPRRLRCLAPPGYLWEADQRREVAAAVTNLTYPAAARLIVGASVLISPYVVRCEAADA